MENEIICTEIYEAALALIGERENEGTGDYAERAPYLLAAFCSEAGALDTLCRSAGSLDKQPAYSAVMIELASVFPLTRRFAKPASLYIAAMLVLDENEELSEKLYDRYCDAMSSICSGIPGAIEKITDIYGC